MISSHKTMKSCHSRLVDIIIVKDDDERSIDYWLQMMEQGELFCFAEKNPVGLGP